MRGRHFLLLLLLSGVAIAAPPDAPPDLKRLSGEYRSTDAKLTIYEAGGQLHAERLALHQAPLRRLTATRFSVDATPPPGTLVQFELNPDGQAASVTVDTSRLQFKDIGYEVVQQIRAGVRSDSGRLRAAALAAKPPTEPVPQALV